MINIYSYKALIKEYPTEKYTFIASPPFYHTDVDGLCSNSYYTINGFEWGTREKLTVYVERVNLIED